MVAFGVTTLIFCFVGRGTDARRRNSSSRVPTARQRGRNAVPGDELANRRSIRRAGIGWWSRGQRHRTSTAGGEGLFPIDPPTGLPPVPATRVRECRAARLV